MKIIGATIQVIGGTTTTELEQPYFPRGTQIRWRGTDIAAGDEVQILGMAGQVVFHGVAKGDDIWDEMILPADVRGVVVSQIDSGVLYFHLPSGRLA